MRISTRIFRLLVLGLATAWAPAALLHAEPKEPADVHPQPGDEDESPDVRDDRPGRLGDHWIGVHCTPVDDPALRAQLGLDRDEGLLVRDVLPDSPAAKAGLKPFDILLTAGGSRLGDLRMLQRAVNSANGGELKIELIRGGKKQTVTVKPTGRNLPPDEWQGELPPDPYAGLRQWALEHRMNVPPQAMPPIYLFGPGVVVPPAVAGLPEDMSVTIIRKGKEPAKITVEQGDKTWEASEDKLSELPARVRHEVEKLLPRKLPGPSRVAPGPGPGRADDELSEALNRQFQALNAQMEQLRKRLEQLEHHGPSDTPRQ